MATSLATLRFPEPLQTVTHDAPAAVLALIESPQCNELARELALVAEKRQHLAAAIAHSRATAAAADAAVDSLGEALEQHETIDQFASDCVRMLRSLLHTIASSMAAMSPPRTYHTPWHAIEMATDCSRAIFVPQIGTPGRGRAVASRFLAALFGAYHDAVQSAGPYANEVASAALFVNEFAANCLPGLAARARWAPEVAGAFCANLRALAVTAIVHGTCLVGGVRTLWAVADDAAARIARACGAAALRGAVFGAAAASADGDPAAAALRGGVAADGLAAVLGHFDTLRYSHEHIASRTAGALRAAVPGLFSGRPAAPRATDADEALLDMACRSGAHLLAGQSVRMLTELAERVAAVASPATTLASVIESFRARLQSGAVAVGDMALPDVAAQFEFVRRNPPGTPGPALTVVRGPLAYILGWHVPRDIAFVLGLDAGDAAATLARTHRDHPFLKGSGGAPFGIRAASLAARDAAREAFATFAAAFAVEAVAAPPQRAAAGESSVTVTLRDAPTAGGAEAVAAKMRAGVLLLWLAAQQDGARGGGLSLDALIRSIAEDAKWR